MQHTNIGVIGLAVMGANLARNLADKKIRTVVYNRSAAKTKEFMEAYGACEFLEQAEDLAELTAKLTRPRKIILMIKAGEPVDAMLEALLPFLESGDIIIDGGNSFFEDTVRRSKSLAAKGIEYVGMGVSGGEEGALHGPSLMPGCTLAAYKELEPMLKAIAAKAGAERSDACVAHIGNGGAGHYVKMVHNGIEYADMQLIADVYSVMHKVLRLSAEEMSTVFAEWNTGELSSYLVEITADILARKDSETGKPMVEMILDKAGQKGTGKWTGISALELGVPVPTISEAVFARNLSSLKEERVLLAEKFSALPSAGEELTPERKTAYVEDLRRTLYAAKICAYAQGFNLLAAAGEHYDWQLNLGEIAKIWRNGCIIRAAFLDHVSESFAENKELRNLLFSEYFAEALQTAYAGWCRILHLAAEAGVAVPALSSAHAYFNGYRTANGNANILQAQRDYFGAHTYERIDKDGFYHTEWQE